MSQHVVNVLLSGVFHASILFLVAAGLQVIFGVQKIFNLACGSFYALGAYVGVSAVGWYTAAGGPPALFIVPLALAGLAVGAVGLVVERGLLSFVYERDETFQLLLTFAVVLMMEDAIRLTWGTAPRSTAGLYLVYGQTHLLGATVPVYNLIVIAASLAIAVAIGWLLTRTTFGRIVRATADNREMAAALGVDLRRVYAKVFTLGTALGTLGGALVIPATAAMSEMGIELIVEAFAVVGIGAYTGAFLTSHCKIRSLEVILIAAAALGALAAAPVGALCVRYVKIYFSMLTLAFGMVFHTFVLKFYRLTGGDEGTPFLRPSLLGRSLEAMPKIDYLVGPYYYYSLAVLVLATLCMCRIVHSPFALCLTTIRDNPSKAETLGIGVTRYRFHAFVISAVYAAVGGALLGPPIGNVDPTLAYWTHSGNIVFMTLLGGFTSFFGPVVGAFVFIYLQHWVMSVVPYWRLIFGAILAAIVIFAPGGLLGLLTPRRAAVRL